MSASTPSEPLGAGASGAPADPPADPVPDHDVRAVLAITPFRRLWLALGLSSFGDWLGLLATTALAAALPQTPAAKLLAVSGVFILRLAPAVFFGPLAGVVADRLPRRWTLVYGDVLRFLLFCSIPLVGTLWWLYVATVLVEVVGLFWMPAKDATVPNLVPRRRLEAANQLSLVVTYGSAPLAAVAFSGLSLVSGMVDGVVPHFQGHPTYLALYVDALTYLVSAAVIWRLDFPEKVSHAERQESILRTAVEGWRYIGSTPLVRGLVLGMLGAFAAGGFVIGLAQSFVGALGAGPPGYGVLFGAVFVGMAAGMWIAPRLLAEFSRRRLFGLSIGAAGGWLVLMSLVPNIALAVFFTLGLGACAGAAWVTGYTLLGLEVGDDVRGRTFAFVQSMVRVVLISVLAIGPVVAAGFSKGLGLPHTVHLTDDVSLTYTGVMATFLLAGLIAMAIGLVAFRQMDDRPGVSLVTDLVQAMRQRHLHHPPARRDPYPGRFVVFEGGDGAGKSTQVRLLGEWLHEQGYRARLTHEPGATPVGHRLREVLLHGEPLTARAEALLFAADRAHHVESVVRPALEDGEIVVSDRFVDSSVAYQGSGRDLGTAEVAQLSRWATQGLTPDLTVVLDVEPHEGRSRRGDEHDRLESESDEFHGRIRERFLELARRAPSRYLVLDAALDPQHLHEQVVARLQGVLPESPVARAAREEREAREAAERAERAAREAAEREERERREAQEREQVERLRAEQEAREQAERAAREAVERQERERREAQERARAEQQAAELAAQQAADAARRRAEERSQAAQPLDRAPDQAADRLDQTIVQAPVDVTAPLPKVTAPPASTPARKPRRRSRRDPDVVALEDEIFGLGEQDDR
ncbi:dTMP kinase [Angustibacter sp. Root456]|uniref:dTMP kinase n=1 Tax=Angustibacter sp. Root456 TaxID=1736539 RepID=UPI0009EAF37A|nr:dTMP kinase [Angustibacter sp. Root456]